MTDKKGVVFFNNHQIVSFPHIDFDHFNAKSVCKMLIQSDTVKISISRHLFTQEILNGEDLFETKMKMRFKLQQRQRQWRRLYQLSQSQGKSKLFEESHVSIFGQ